MADMNDVLIRDERDLDDRPSRSPDFASENEALRELAHEMSNRPDRVLQTLCEQVMLLCGAESAGVSLLRDTIDDPSFEWAVVVGEWSRYAGSGMPRDASPCGQVIAQNKSLIFQDIVRQFPAAAGASPLIEEVLLAPFHQEGKPIGTVWALTHTPGKRFDREDRRLLESLARFAGAVYQVTNASTLAKEARSQLSLLNHELAHRLKNTLAMVMARAQQTLKDIADQEAVKAFQKRLLALGSAHDILIDQSWVAAPLRLIAERVIGGAGQAQRTTINGPDVTLGPRAAVTFSLVLHELATNAIKYGAFSAGTGQVSLEWHITSGPDPSIVVDWRETGGPTPVEPGGRGFGSRLINMGIAGTGGATLLFEDSGLVAHFEAPLRQAQAEHPGDNPHDA